MAKSKTYKKPLLGKVFYLDLTKYRNTTALKANLILLGANLEGCFSKEVHCLVTDNVEYTNKYKTLGTSPSNPSPGTPSPISTGLIKIGGSVGSPQADSPGDGVSSNRLTRGQKFLDARKKKSYGTLIENAQKWKIQIITLEKILKYVESKLAEMPASVRNASINKGKAKPIKKQPKVRKLKGNYLKFEATNKHYRPLQQEFAEFPIIDLASGSLYDKKKKKCTLPGTLEERAEYGTEKIAGIAVVGDSATVPKQSKQSTPKSTKKKNKASKKDGNVYDFTQSDEGNKVYTAGELRKMLQDKIKAEQKKGYCEICETKYDDIKKHQWTDQHLNFVRNVDNFAALDHMIETGPNFERFLSDVVKYHQEHVQEGMNESEMEDEVLLIKEGLSSPLVKPKKKKKLLKSVGICHSNLSTTSSKRLNFDDEAQSKKKVTFLKRSSTKRKSYEKSPQVKSPCKKSTRHTKSTPDKRMFCNDSKKLHRDESKETPTKKSTNAKNTPVPHNNTVGTPSKKQDLPNLGDVEDTINHVRSPSKTLSLSINYVGSPKRKCSKLTSGQSAVNCTRILNRPQVIDGNEDDLTNRTRSDHNRSLENTISPRKPQELENNQNIPCGTAEGSENNQYTSQDSGIHISHSSPTVTDLKNNSKRLRYRKTRSSSRNAQGNSLNSKSLNDGEMEGNVIRDALQPNSIHTEKSQTVPAVTNIESSATCCDKSSSKTTNKKFKSLSENVSNVNFNECVSSQVHTPVIENGGAGRVNIRSKTAHDKKHSQVEIGDSFESGRGEGNPPIKLVNHKEQKHKSNDTNALVANTSKESNNNNVNMSVHDKGESLTRTKMSEICLTMSKKASLGKSREEISELKRKKKIKKKLKDSWQVLSDRSMRKMFDSEGDCGEFEGYTADSISESELPLDVSYIDLTEVEYSDNSEVEWIFSEVDVTKPTSKDLPLISNIIKSPEKETDRASSVWNKPIDYFVEKHAGNQMKRVTRNLVAKQKPTIDVINTSNEKEATEEAHQNKENQYNANDRSFEMEKSVTIAHRGNPVEMLNRVFSRYLSGVDVEELWVDPSKKCDSATSLVQKQVSQSTSIIVNTSQCSVNDQAFDQELSPEIPFMGRKVIPYSIAENSVAKVALDFSPNVKESTQPLNSLVNSAPSEILKKSLSTGIKRLGEMQKTQDFDGLMHSTPLRTISCSAANNSFTSSSNLNVNQTPLGIKPLLANEQSGLLGRTSNRSNGKNSSSVNSRALHLKRDSSITRKSLNSLFNKQALISRSNGVNKSGELGDSASQWQFDIKEENEVEIDQDIVFNFNSPQKNHHEFSPLKLKNKDISFLRSLNDSLNTSANHSVVKNLSGIMLSQAGLEVSTLVTKKKTPEHEMNSSNNEVVSPKSPSQKKLMKSVSQELKDTARYKFDYMSSKKRKKENQIKWYSDKVIKSKKFLQSVAQNNKETESNSSPPKKARFNSIYKAERKLLSPRRSRGKKQNHGKSVYSFKSGYTVRLNILKEKRRRGCLCHEHTPSSKCPNAKEEKRLQISPLRKRSCSRSPVKRSISPRKISTSPQKRLRSSSRISDSVSLKLPKIINNAVKSNRISSPTKDVSSTGSRLPKRDRSNSPKKEITVSPRKSRHSEYKLNQRSPRKQVSPKPVTKRQSITGNNVYEFTSPNKSSPLKSLSMPRSVAKKNLFMQNTRSSRSHYFGQNSSIYDTNTITKVTNNSPDLSRQTSGVKSPKGKMKHVLERLSDNTEKKANSDTNEISHYLKKKCVKSVKNSPKLKMEYVLKRLSNHSTEKKPNSSTNEVPHLKRRHVPPVKSSPKTRMEYVLKRLSINSTERKSKSCTKEVAYYLKKRSVYSARKVMQRKKSAVSSSLMSKSLSTCDNKKQFVQNDLTKEPVITARRTRSTIDLDNSSFLNKNNNTANESSVISRKRTRSTFEVDDVPALKSNNHKVTEQSATRRKKTFSIVEDFSEKRNKTSSFSLCSKRERSPSVSSVTSSVQSDGDKRANALLKRLNVNFTDEQLCAMFVPTTTRSCSSVCSDNNYIARSKADQSKGENLSNVSNERTNNENPINHTIQAQDDSVSPPRKKLCHSLKGNKTVAEDYIISSQSSGPKELSSPTSSNTSLERKVVIDGIILNTPATKAMSQRTLRKVAVRLSPLTPRTTSHLFRFGKTKSPFTSKSPKSHSRLSKSPTSASVKVSKTPTSVRTSPVLKRRSSLRHSGKVFKKMADLVT